MYPVSDELLKRIQHTHIATFRAEVSPNVGSLERIPMTITDGKITIDRNRDILRTTDVTLVDENGTLTPTDAEDLLAPYGTELYLYRGVVLNDGTIEEIPQGVFRITDFDVEYGQDGVSVSLKGSDRAYVVQRATWEEPFVVETGTDLGEAIFLLLKSRFPEVEVNVPALSGSTWRAVFDGEESDPWQDAQKLANAGGMELFFDDNGVASAQAPATLEEPPIFTYEEGEDAIVISVSRSLTSSTGVFNAVIATSENTELAAPLRSFVIDDDPDSPTYYYGPFGKVHRKWSSQLITTQEQLDKAARTMLALSLGSSEEVQIEAVVNPALRPNDVVRIINPRVGIADSNMIIDTVDLGMSPSGTQTLTGRRRFL